MLFEGHMFDQIVFAAAHCEFSCLACWNSDLRCYVLVSGSVLHVSDTVRG